MTIREAAEALGVTQQAIRSRITNGTMEQFVDPESGGVRVRREVIEQEAAGKHGPATRADTGEIDLLMQERTEFLVERLTDMGGQMLGALSDGDDKITGAIESQISQVVPLLEALLAALAENAERQRRMLGRIEELKNAENEEHRLLRQVVARADEEDKREREYQRRNLEIQEENLGLLKETREENARAREGGPERRRETVSRRFMLWATVALITSVWLAVLLTVVDIYFHVTS